jgi:hypothetical protein
LPEIKAKLRVDGEAIGDNTARFYYVYEENHGWDYNTILDQLARVYDNPNRVQEAEDAL